MLKRSHVVLFSGLALALFGAVLFTSLRQVRRAQESEAQVAQTLALRFALSDLLSAVQDVETGARGFALTGVKRFMEPLEAGLSGLHSSTSAVRGLLPSDAATRQELAALEALASRTVAYSALLVQIRRERGLDAAAVQLLNERDARSRRERANLYWFVAVGSSLAMALLAVVLALLVRANERRAAREVTETKALADALRASEAYNRSIVENNPDCLKLLTLDARLIYMSPGGCRIMEVDDFGTVENADWLAFWTGDDRVAAERAVNTARLGGRGSFEGACPTAKGTPRWWDVVITPVLGADGQPERLLCVSRDITARRVSEQTLQGSQATVATLIEQAPDAIVVVDHGGAIRRVNAQFERFFGYARAEAIGQPIELLVPDSIRPTHKGLRDAYLEDPDARVLGAGRQLKARRKDGSEFDVDITLSPIETTDGRFVMAVVRDISAQRRAEASLRESEERFRQLSETMPDAVLVEQDGRFIYGNRAAALLYGAATPEDLVGLEFSAVVESTQLELAQQLVQRVLAGERLEMFATGFVRRDGSSVSVEVSSSPLQWNGRPALQAVVRNVTERKATQDALRQAHDALEQRVSERTAELVAANESLRDEVAQRIRVEQLMERDQEVMRMVAGGRPLPDILETLVRNFEAQNAGVIGSILQLDEDGVHMRHGAAPSLPEAYNRAIDGAAIGPTAGSCGTAAYLRRQVIVTDIATDPLWVEYKGLALPHNLRACWSTPIQNAEGQVLGTFAIYARQPGSPTPEDISQIDRITDLASIAMERARAEARLRRANEQLEARVLARTTELHQANVQLAQVSRLKDEFLANMSHELRTPLNSILGLSETLLEQLAHTGSPRQVKALTTISASGHHLLSLINDILDLSKIEAGKLELHISPLRLDEFCESCLAFVRTQAMQKHISVSFEPDARAAHFLADPKRLKQILVNLLSNAVKFTPEGGRIGLAVGVAEGEEALRFTVWDTGIGIAPEDQQTLFSPFTQIDSGLSRGQEGTGLGLALVAKLVELHGGSVALESEPGHGSRFIVTLPLDAVPVPAPVLASEAEQGRRDYRAALIVEDDPTAAAILEGYLIELGLSSVVHVRGEGAVDAALRGRPDVILLDILLPGESGWVVLATLKDNPATREIPVVVVSVVDEPERSQALGAAAHFTKPVTRDQLAGFFQHPVKRMQRRHALRSAPRPAAGESEAVRGALLLLAEDNAANAETIGGYLEYKGYTVAYATNGLEAVKLASELRPALILMDVQMPVMDGLTAIRELHADASLRAIPIVALTALAMAGDRERCLEAGATEYMTKPVSPKALVTLVRRLLPGRDA